MTKATTLIAAALLITAGAHAQTDIQALKARAEAGEVEAQYKLGYSYANGEGVPQNHVEAVQLILLADINHAIQESEEEGQRPFGADKGVGQNNMRYQGLAI